MILRKGADDSSPCGLKVWVRGGVVLGSIGWCRDPGGVEGTASGSSRGGARPCPPLLPRHRAHLASAEPTPTTLQVNSQQPENMLTIHQKSLFTNITNCPVRSITIQSSSNIKAPTSYLSHLWGFLLMPRSHGSQVQNNQAILMFYSSPPNAEHMKDLLPNLSGEVLFKVQVATLPNLLHLKSK